MAKELWLNLPVKDVQKSKDFYSAIGFTFNAKHSDTNYSACLQVGDKPFIVMLFSEGLFKTFTGSEISDTSKGSEILISIDAQSVEETNELAQKVRDAGGQIYSEPKENQGWMYGFAFADLDGHRWNVLYMDMAKMPKV